jgi:hypothetical protein
LKEAITETGAERLSAAWIKDNILSENKSTFGKKEEIIELIRTRAVLGIVFSGNYENIELIRNSYKIEKEKFRLDKEGKSPEDFSRDFYNSLAEAMGKLDYINEHSIDEFLELQSDPKYLETILPYEAKYSSVINELYMRFLENEKPSN